MGNRIFTAILSGLVFIYLIAGCAADDPDTSAETTAAGEMTNEEETRIYPDLPDVKYDGYEYTFYSWLIEDWRTWLDIDTDELDGEIINDAVYNRNLTIENKYDVKITCIYDQYLTYEANVTKNVRAGDDFADVLLSMGHDIPRGPPRPVASSEAASRNTSIPESSRRALVCALRS